MKPIELDPSRHNMKPRPSGLTDEQYLLIALKEGYALLEAESKLPPKCSVKKPLDPALKPCTIPSPSKVQDSLAKTSTNPYVRSRAEIMEKLTAKARAAVEGMEDGSIPKDKNYQMFIDQVMALGDKYSGLN